MPRDSSDVAGFTLLETLVAFLILSVSLSVALQSMTQSTAFEARARLSSDLRIAARSVLAETLSKIRSPGKQAGTEAGMFDWSLEVKPYSVRPNVDLLAYEFVISTRKAPKVTKTYVGFLIP